MENFPLDSVRVVEGSLPPSFEAEDVLEAILYYHPCQPTTRPAPEHRMPGGRTKGVSMGSDADVVLGVIKAVEERDGEKLFELYHDDVELHEAPSLPYGGTVKGVPSLKEQLETAPEDTWLGTWGPVQPTEAERRFDPRVLSAWRVHDHNASETA